jgi:predicted metal-dependent HD superfamily phosphohydrolase
VEKEDHDGFIGGSGQRGATMQELDPNEERSAALAVEALAAAGLNPSIGERVKRLILSTTHSVVPEDRDEQLLADVDLSILGRDWELFDRYDRAIRKEYEWVADDRYRPARAAVLRGFLDRPRIFQTAHFFTRCESPARDNLRKAIERLHVPDNGNDNITPTV